MSYTVLIDSVDPQQWEQYAGDFADYSIYQTWPYQQVRGEKDRQQVSRFVIKDNAGQVTTMGHVRIKRVKPLGLAIGYVQWGPLLRRKNDSLDCTVAALEKLREAYLGTEVNILRIVPNIFRDEAASKVTEMLEASGFRIVPYIKPYHTMVLPLDLPNDEIFRKLHRSWKRGLEKGEQTDLEIKEGPDIKYFSILDRLYRTTVQRKGFKGLNPEEFMRPQQMLSDREKMNIVVAYFKGEPVAAHATSHLGDTAVGTLAASSEKGLELGASYLVWWRTLLAAKSVGMKRYDLGGIDPKNNPTVYQFKQRMGAHEVFHIGAFEAHTTTVIKNVWWMAERVYRFVKV